MYLVNAWPLVARSTEGGDDSQVVPQGCPLHRDGRPVPDFQDDLAFFTLDKHQVSPTGENLAVRYYELKKRVLLESS